MYAMPEKTMTIFDYLREGYKSRVGFGYLIAKFCIRASKQIQTHQYTHRFIHKVNRNEGENR